VHFHPYASVTNDNQELPMSAERTPLLSASRYLIKNIRKYRSHRVDVPAFLPSVFPPISGTLAAFDPAHNVP
jgi:hypothetical protein